MTAIASARVSTWINGLKSRELSKHGLVTLVSALVPQRLLVSVEEPTVPGLEEAGEVNVQGLLDVDHNEFIEITWIGCVSTKY